MSTRLASTALRREMAHLSIQQARMFSKTAVTVERAAKKRNTKNMAPHSRPPGMALKTLGRVTKIRLGPASGCTPKAKAEGKMIRPEMKATQVSRIPTLMASPNRRRSLPM